MKTYNQYKGDIVERYQKEWDAIDKETQHEILEAIKHEEGETLDEWVGKVLKGVGKLPGIRTAVGLGMAGYRAAKGDWTGAGLSLGSAIPGPVGWGFVGADIARDMNRGGGGNTRSGGGNTQTPGQSGSRSTTTTPGQTTRRKQVTFNKSGAQRGNLNINFANQQFKTKGSWGNPKSDHWSSQYSRPGSRSRSQVEADDRRESEARTRQIAQRSARSYQSSHRK